MATLTITQRRKNIQKKLTQAERHKEQFHKLAKELEQDIMNLYEFGVDVHAFVRRLRRL